MAIYVVKQGDNINTIAEIYGVSVDRLIYDNGLINPNSLIPGQTIAIVYPNQTHIVQEGDTLNSIANAYGVTLMELLRNNSFLVDRNYIFPGETIVISYPRGGEITTNGYAYANINNTILKKTLPYLTFLSVFNYGISDKGDIITYSDDMEIIKTTTDFGTIPLLMVSTLTPTGEPNPTLDNLILLNEELQDKLIVNILSTIEDKGYSGINYIVSDINLNNQHLYIDFIAKISERLGTNRYLFVTIDPHIKEVDNTITFDQLDYNDINQNVYRLTFLSYAWATNKNPPQPVSSIKLLRVFMDYVVSVTNPDTISLGKPLIAYDWTLPFIPGTSFATSMSLNSALILAKEEEVIIRFDDPSQTPFYYYIHSIVGAPDIHVVWFLDARSIEAIDDLIDDYGLIGSGVWNIMIFYQQLWTLTNSRYSIIKLIPDNIS